VPEDQDQQTPPEDDKEQKLPTEETPPVTEPVDDDAYEDVLYAALTKIYNEIDSGDSGEAEGEPETNEDGTPKPPKKPVEEMSLEEIRSELARTRGTLKEVVGLSLQEREERAAMDTWNGFIKDASPVEAAIAKSMSFEVEDKDGMDRQVKQVKMVAATVEKLIGEQVGSRVGGIKQNMRTNYGILTPEPELDEDPSAQDAKDMKAGDHASVIARRFRNRTR